MKACLSFFMVLTQSTSVVSNHVKDFSIHFYAIPDNQSAEVLQYNTLALETALNSLKPFDTLTIRQNYHLHHGVNATDLKDVVVQIDGSLHFERDFSEAWNEKTYRVDATIVRPKPCLTLDGGENITFTSTNPKRGLIHGGGPQWWGVPFLGYIKLSEHRPRLFHAHRTVGLVMEHLILQDAPFHSLNLWSVNHVLIHHVSIVSRRTTRDGHGFVDLSAFNTDGIDVSGHNIHVHDVDIWNQDDCIAVKDNDSRYDIVSSNMTFERINASGLGFVIGSIAGTTVRNITFRDSYLYKSYKGIYLKFREPESLWKQPGVIEDILFENITMESPEQWAIWIGPAQQTGGRSRDPCHASPCSLCWPAMLGADCHVVKYSKFRNITLKDITIYNPSGTGVIFGHEDTTIDHVVFDNVRMITKDFATSMMRYDSFPGLEQEVDDPYVQTGYLLVSAIIGSIMTLMIHCCVTRSLSGSGVCRNTRSYEGLNQDECLTRSDDDDDQLGDFSKLRNVFGLKPRRSLMRMAMLVMVLTLAVTSGFFADRRVSVMRRRSDESNYFVCLGVLNGVAKGGTYPVPYCFEDQTIR